MAVRGIPTACFNSIMQETQNTNIFFVHTIISYERLFFFYLFIFRGLLSLIEVFIRGAD